MSTRRIYLIGAGVIAQTHASAVQKLLNNEGMSISVTDINLTALEAFQKRFPDAKVFTDIEVMLGEPADPEDIVVVATPPSSHYALAKKALQTNRHVLCEKPLTMTSEEAEELYKIARQNHCLLGACSTRFLGNPTSDKVKELLNNKTLGEIYHVRFIHRANRSRAGIEYQPKSRWFLERAKSGGGIIMDWGPYDFTCLNDVLNPLKVDVVSAWMTNPQTALDFDENEVVFDVEEHAGASLIYHLEGGQQVNVTYERASCTHGEEQQIAEIEGTKGSVKWDWCCFKKTGEIVHAFDENGEKVQQAMSYPIDNERLSHWDKPIYFFHQLVNGEDSPATVNERALFNFLCVRAVYECVHKKKAVSIDFNHDNEAGLLNGIR